MNTATQRFARGLVGLVGADPAVLSAPGTTAVADESRAGSRHVACYQIGGHTLMPCDPEVIDTVRLLDDGEVSLTDADFRSWVPTVGGTILGRAVMKSVGVNALQLVEPLGTVHVFDWSRPADVALMQAFVDGCEQVDLDAAEVDMENLDERAVALLDDNGAIQAFASSVEYEVSVPFGDIGILTAPGLRRGGWGRSAVSALVRDVFDPAGIDPLYRCDPDNTGSDRLSAALGFELAASMTVAQLAEA